MLLLVVVFMHLSPILKVLKPYLHIFHKTDRALKPVNGKMRNLPVRSYLRIE